MTLLVDEQSASRQRVLDVAERYFMERGYNAIALRDIADALGIKQSSLYYHFPLGKEELYVAVTERAFARHAEGMSTAIASEATLAAQLAAVADWFATQPTMCLMGMIHADLPALHDEQTLTVERAAALGLFRPLVAAFTDAIKRGEVDARHDANLLAGAFLALLDGLTIGVTFAPAVPRQSMAAALIDLFLNGAHPRS